MTVLAHTIVQVNLDRSCCLSPLVYDLHRKLDTPNYTRGVSLMLVPDSLEEWRAEHRTARKRADRAQRLGYGFGTIDRSQRNDQIHAINTSLTERQGRPMSDGYLKPVQFGALPDYPCDRHRVHTYGVVKDDVLYAYLNLYRVGELALVSMILGHGDHLKNDVMWLLFAGLVSEQAGLGGWFYYNRHDSGTDGLRYYKEHQGFREMDLEWVL